jgi:phytoene desaturase
MRQAIVIGAGLGGLGTAIRLRQAGWDVTLLEKNDRVGGRCGVIRGDGFTIDTGPTLLLMRDVLDALFASAGRRTEDYLDLVRIHPNYRIHFGDGTSLDVTSDREALLRNVETFEPGAGPAMTRYLQDAGYKYRVSRDRFVERNFLRWSEFLTASNLYYLFATNTLRKLDRHAARYFRDPRLRAAMTFQTMYLGLAPHDAPAVYSLLPYTEIEEGIWYPCGGMTRIAEGLARLATELGVDVRLNANVRSISISGRRALGVVLSDDTFVAGEVVVSNADLPYTYGTLLPRAVRGSFTDRRLRRLNYGSSAFLLYLGLNRRYPELLHHNVYLSRAIRANFDAVFREFRLPDDPSLYVCVPSRTDPSVAPEGSEAMYVLVPVPRSTPNVDWGRQRIPFRDRILDRLEEVGMGDIRQRIVFERTYTPDDFVSDYNVVNGSAFGLSHGFRQVGYMRPANKARDLENVYFAGASTVPGGGVPMVLIGSRLTVERIEQDYPGV